MHILIGVIVAVAVLAGWLTGHWFARVLAFLLLAGLCLLVIPDGTPTSGIVAVALAAIIWPIASIPTYINRQRMNRLGGVSMVKYRD